MFPFQAVAKMGVRPQKKNIEDYMLILAVATMKNRPLEKNIKGSMLSGRKCNNSEKYSDES